MCVSFEIENFVMEICHFVKKKSPKQHGERIFFNLKEKPKV